MTHSWKLISAIRCFMKYCKFLLFCLFCYLFSPTYISWKHFCCKAPPPSNMLHHKSFTHPHLHFIFLLITSLLHVYQWLSISNIRGQSHSQLHVLYSWCTWSEKWMVLSFDMTWKRNFTTTTDWSFITQELLQWYWPWFSLFFIIYHSTWLCSRSSEAPE